MISVTGLVHFVLVMIVIGLIFWLLHWLISYTGVPEPFAKVARVVLAVGAVVVIIFALLQLVGGYPIIRL